ncbi:MAG: lmo0937 family membrane protein [Elusimicrobia bacterium]|nr:lmo0937 family membrane protein [Elusimicrobiota bacterium]
MLDVVILLVLLSWLGGFSLHVGGGLIHLLIVIALIMLVFRIASGRRV